MSVPSNLNQILSGSEPFNLAKHHYSLKYRPLPFLADLNAQKTFEAIYDVLIQQVEQLDSWADAVPPGTCVTMLWRNPPSYVGYPFIESVCNIVAQDIRSDLAVGVMDKETAAKLVEQKFGPSLERYIIFGFVKIQDPT